MSRCKQYGELLLLVFCFIVLITSIVEGTGLLIFGNQSPPGTVPVHRFYHTKFGTHFYTLNNAEVKNLTENYPHIWTYEGVAFRAWEQDVNDIVIGE